MAGKELFNQTLKETLGDFDRIPVGVPSQEGCDNILKSDFFGSVMQIGKDVSITAGGQIVTFTKALGSADFVLFVRSHDGVGYEITAQTSANFTINTIANTTIDYVAILF